MLRGFGKPGDGSDTARAKANDAVVVNIYLNKSAALIDLFVRDGRIWPSNGPANGSDVVDQSNP